MFRVESLSKMSIEWRWTQCGIDVVVDTHYQNEIQSISLKRTKWENVIFLYTNTCEHLDETCLL